MQTWDLNTLLWINGHHSPALDYVVYPISLLGERGLLVVLLALGVLVGGPKGRWKEWAAVGIILMMANRLLVELSAWYVYRERPFMAIDGVRQMGPLWYTSSFPSGHAQYVWLVVVLLGAQHPRWLWALIPFSLLTCYSRPYFGMHYPSDVLAGSALGVVSGIAMLAVQRWWRRRLTAAPPAKSAP
jgi:membrane-associated phospholipid phosphatase